MQPGISFVVLSYAQIKDCFIWMVQ